MTLIDRLERRFGWIAIPGVVKVIVAFQALIWVLNMFRDNDLIFHLLLYLDKDLILSGQVWRLFSFILIPPVEAGAFIFMLFAVFFTIFMGNMLEQIWGSFRLTLYLLGGIVSVVIAEFAVGFNGDATLPTFLIVESILFACAVYNPNYVIHLFGIIPIRLFWIALFAAALLFITATQSLVVAALILISLMNFFVVFVPGMKKSIEVKAQVSSRRNQFEKAKVSPNEAFHYCKYCDKTEQDDEELVFRVAANGEEFCEDCRDQVGVLKNEENSPSRIIERSSKKPKPSGRKGKKERWSFDEEDS